MSVERQGRQDFDSRNRKLVTEVERDAFADQGNEVRRTNFLQVEPESNEAWAIHRLVWHSDIRHEDASGLNPTDLKVPRLAVVSQSESFEADWHGDTNFADALIVEEDGVFMYELRNYEGSYYNGTDGGVNANESHVVQEVEFEKPYLLTDSGDLNLHLLALSTAADADVIGDNALQIHQGLLVEYERFELDLAGSIDFNPVC